MNNKSVAFDIVDYFKTPEDMAEYLNAVMDDNEPILILSALQDIVRTKGGLKYLSETTGLTVEVLSKILSDSSNPTLDNLMMILSAFDLRLMCRSNKAA